MAVKQIRVSDLTGEEIGGEENVATFIVQRHPNLDLETAVTLDVLDEEIEDKLPQEHNYVVVHYYPSESRGGGELREAVLTLEEFNSLSEDYDMETVLEDAVRAEKEQQGRRRGRRRGRQAGQRRTRVDYSSPEHAGEPHRGRITDAEREYVQNNLDEVNARLSAQGMREIDPSDPDMAERYGLTG